MAESAVMQQVLDERLMVAQGLEGKCKLKFISLFKVAYRMRETVRKTFVEMETAIIITIYGSETCSLFWFNATAFAVCSSSLAMKAVSWCDDIIGGFGGGIE